MINTHALMAKDTNFESNENTVYLVDGSSFIFRAYHALPPMTRSDGTPINAVFGFTNMLIKLLADMDAPLMAVIFDAKRKNFRNDIYKEYKANRDDPPDDLIPQFGLIREATEAFDLPVLELEGFEADDLIATYARIALEGGLNVVIVSSDKDLMQLVRDGVVMFDPMKSKYMGPDEVVEKFGVLPDKVVDVQALAGDSVDNVPGVPGIGVKTAAQLINEYGDLETLLARAEEIKQPKRRESLIEHADMARISKKLVALDHNVDVPIGFEAMKTAEPTSHKLLDFLKEQGFRSSIARIEKQMAEEGKEGILAHSSNDNDSADAQDESGSFPPVAKNEYTLIQDVDVLKQWMDEARKTGVLAVDTETTSLTPAKAELVGVSIAATLGKAAYIPLSHKDPNSVGEQGFDFGGDDTKPDAGGKLKQIPMDEAMAVLKPVLEDPSILKVGHNIKYDLQLFMAQGVHVAPIDDTMMLSYVLDGSMHGHGMDELAETFCAHQTIKFKDVAGTGKNQVTFDYVSLDTALDYAAEDAEITLRLHKIFKPRLARERMATVYETIERPLLPVIAQMEHEGIKVDPTILKTMSTDFGKKLVDLEEQIHEMAGQPFNIASPKQMGQILFGEMGLEGGKKTKTGDWSTSADVLEKLAVQGGHEIVERILEWRQLSKLKSTYTDALQNEINPKTGRIHTSFSLAGTSTGRLASSDPNLQNIPIRTEEGRKIRTAFVADAGHILLSVDYSQVELRLVAQMAGIDALKQAFKDGTDIHALTASEVFGVPMEEMTPETRRKAKAINFGIIYGISGYGLARQLGCEPGEANEYIKLYFSRFPELAAYMEETKDIARKQGYVETIFGRKCYLRGIKDKNHNVRSFAERQAINAPIQGTAADIMKRAMIRMPGALADAGLSAKMLLQVHDELVFEVPKSELDRTSDLVVQVMQDAAELDVPLLAEAGSGKSWSEAH